MAYMNRDEYQDMTDEELIGLIHQGDSESMDFLIDKYKDLVKKKARAMYLIGGDNDDLIQEGMIGLFKAVRGYYPEKEASFFGFAELCITRQIYTAIKASQRKKHSPLNSYVSLYATTISEQGDNASLADTIYSDNNPEDMVIEKEAVTLMEEKLKKYLSSLENEVLTLYLEGKNYNQIAEILGKEQKSVDNALQRVKSKATEIINKG